MATYPMPTSGQFNSPWFQAFLGQHPAFARATREGRMDEFLDGHPNIATAYRNLLNPPAQPPVPVTTTPPATSTPSSSAGVGPSTNPESARAIITDTLRSYGLEALGGWAWQQYLNGTPQEKIFIDMRERPEYKQRFPAMAALSSKGQAISEAEYIAAERSYGEQMRAYGLPAGFYDSPDDFSKLIAGNVGAMEFGERLAIVAEATMTDPRGQQMRAELSRLYGIENATGAVIAYFIDPDRGSTLIKQQAAAAEIAVEAATTGFGSLTKQQAERVAGWVSPEQSRAGFGSLAAMDELRRAGVGDAGDTGVSDDDLLDAGFGQDAAARDRVERTARRRVAAFDGGGQFAASQAGVTGLGSAAT